MNLLSTKLHVTVSARTNTKLETANGTWKRNHLIHVKHNHDTVEDTAEIKRSLTSFTRFLRSTYRKVTWINHSLTDCWELFHLSSVFSIYKVPTKQPHVPLFLSFIAISVVILKTSMCLLLLAFIMHKKVHSLSKNHLFTSIKIKKNLIQEWILLKRTI